MFGRLGLGAPTLAPRTLRAGGLDDAGPRLRGRDDDSQDRHVVLKGAGLLDSGVAGDNIGFDTNGGGLQGAVTGYYFIN